MQNTHSRPQHMIRLHHLHHSASPPNSLAGCLLVAGPLRLQNGWRAVGDGREQLGRDAPPSRAGLGPGLPRVLSVLSRPLPIAIYPPPPCESLKCDGNNTYRCADTGAYL